MTEAPPQRHRRANSGLHKCPSMRVQRVDLIIEDREASLVAKYAFAEPRYWATASQAMRGTDSAPAVT